MSMKNSNDTIWNRTSGNFTNTVLYCVDGGYEQENVEVMDPDKVFKYSCSTA